MKLQDKVAIVTGAGSPRGIGQAIALKLAEEGANVVAADIDVESASKLAEKIRALGGKAIAVKTDVTKSEEVKLMAKATLDEFGKIDILVNNAGGSARERNRLFCQSSEEVWDYVLGINLRGVMNCCRAVIEHMMEQRSGKIVSIASTTATVGTPGIGLADYAAAKAGIIGFSQVLAKEVASYGINVNCVSPGPVETRAMLSMSDERKELFVKQSGLGRIGKPEDVAYLVAFLVSDEASFITGQNYAVCGLTNLGM